MVVKLGSLSEQFTTTQFQKWVPKMFGDTLHRVVGEDHALFVVTCSGLMFYPRTQGDDPSHLGLLGQTAAFA